MILPRCCTIAHIFIIIAKYLNSIGVLKTKDNTNMLSTAMIEPTEANFNIITNISHINAEIIAILG